MIIRGGVPTRPEYDSGDALVITDGELGRVEDSNGVIERTCWVINGCSTRDTASGLDILIINRVSLSINPAPAFTDRILRSGEESSVSGWKDQSAGP